MQLLNGLQVAKTIKEKISADVLQLTQNGYRAPHLAAILVGSDGASQTYVNSKEVGLQASRI
jgi:methylenetetrahydrofolate dehydrogenase (NADP+)/methenyltetrahydrofolate cyclohydrolase